MVVLTQQKHTYQRIPGALSAWLARYLEICKSKSKHVFMKGLQDYVLCEMTDLNFRLNLRYGIEVAT